MSAWVGTIGKGSDEPDTRPRVSPRQWCYRRVMPAIERGEYGNAFGQLRADLARDPETVGLVKELEALPFGLDSLRDFVERNLW